MKNNYLRSLWVLVLFLSVSAISAQTAPTAGFSISPTPVCTGNIIQITDLSTNQPSVWSYTIRPPAMGPGGQPTVVSVQNPTFSFNMPGTYSISLVSSNGSGSSAVVSQTINILAGPNANINPQTSTSCIGGTPVNIVVTAGGAPNLGPVSYSWSNGAVINSITVSPSVTTVYNCVVSSTNGCSVQRTSTVIISTPSVTITGVPASICPGTTSTLMATGSGAVPWTYTWSTGSNVNSITSSVTGVFTASVTNALGCTGVQTYTLGSSPTLSLTVSSNPSVLCAGGVATLNVSGAATYTWSTGSSASTPTINPNSNASYTVSGQIGTCTGTAAISINVSTIPTVAVLSSPVSLCSGASATLSASGASTYTWNPGGAFSSSLVVSPNTTTTYSVRGLNPGCPARTSTISVLVNPSPVLTSSSSSSLICTGEVAALVGNGAASYSWSASTNPGVTIGTSNIIIITPSVTTTYSLIGANSFGCKAVSVITQSVSDCTGLTKTSGLGQNLRVFPNPAYGTVLIQTSTNAELSLISQTGQLIKNIRLNEENNRSLEVSDLSNGIYFIVGKSVEGTFSEKIVILK